MPPELQAFLGGITLADLVLWTVGIGALIAGVKWVIPAIRKAIDFFDDVAGEPARPGVPARPGLMERIGTLESVLAQVKHEVMPNTGTSLRDAADRTEAAVTTLQTGMNDVHSKLDNDNKRIADLAEQLDTHIEQSTAILNKLPKEKP